MYHSGSESTDTSECELPEGQPHIIVQRLANRQMAHDRRSRRTRGAVATSTDIFKNRMFKCGEMQARYADWGTTMETQSKDTEEGTIGDYMR